MENFDLFGVGLRSARGPILTAQRRVNVYYEIVPDEDARGFKIAVMGTDGLELFVDFGDTPARAMYQKGDYLYVIHRGTFWEVNNAGVKTSRGTLTTTTGRCYMSDNGTQIMVVDSAGSGYIYTIATTTLAPIADPDFPGAENVTWQDGFFIVPKPDSGRFYISGSYDGTSWVSTEFKNAESQPDNNVLAIADGGTLYVFGSLSTEVYGNTGTAGVPFTRIQGATLEWGLAAKDSLAKYQDSLIGLFRNEMGQMVVARVQGYRADRVSTSDLEAIIRSYGAFSDATGFAYMKDGHPFYQISFPTGNATWLYDGSTGMWNQRQSGLAETGRHRAELYVNYLDQTVVSDYENGRIYKMKPDVYTENGDPIKRLLASKHLMSRGNPITVDELRLFFETGVGLATGQGSDPQIMLRISKDGGRTWGPQKLKTLGAIGEYLARVRFQQLGQSEDWVFEVSMTDPVPFRLVGEALQTEVAEWA